MTFTQPLYFLLFIPLIAYILYYILSYKHRESKLTIPTFLPYKKVRINLRTRLLHLPFILRLIALTCLIFVLARPQTKYNWLKEQTEGIDIMLTIDISSSMLLSDFKPTRIDVIREVAKNFVDARPNDNIGLTLFSGEAFTACPLTSNHTILLQKINNSVNCELTNNGLILDGTAIGMGVSNAVLNLKKSKAKSKVIILLTDGDNNAGSISPLTSAKLAKDYNIRMYTIALGRNGIVEYLDPVFKIPVQTETHIDIPTLTKMAKITGGNFYQATDTKALQKVYSKIDKLEKTKLEAQQKQIKYEGYLPFALIALIALIAEFILTRTWLKILPG